MQNENKEDVEFRSGDDFKIYARCKRSTWNLMQMRTDWIYGWFMLFWLQL